jgi:hypothetical protein
LAISGAVLVEDSVSARPSAGQTTGANSVWLERSRTSETAADGRAFEAISRLHLRNYESEAFRGTNFYGCGYAQKDSTDPRDVLCAMGVDAVPALVEALGDRSDTNTVTHPGRGRTGERRVWKLGDLAARILFDTCGRNFTVGPMENQKSLLDLDPAVVPELQRIILDWYASNRGASEVELRIQALEEPDGGNRLRAAEWLAYHRSAEGAVPIERALDRSLARKVKTSLDDREIAELAKSLGRIGMESSLPAVRRALAYHDDLFGRAPRESERLICLFLCYRALAELGQVEEAVSRLEVLYAEKQSELDEYHRQRFQQQLKDARAW